MTPFLKQLSGSYSLQSRNVQSDPLKASSLLNYTSIGYYRVKWFKERGRFYNTKENLLWNCPSVAHSLNTFGGNELQVADTRCVK